MDWSILLAVGILVVVLLAGPAKIPELARSLGKAKREYERALNGQSETKSQDNVLIDTAKSLGINTKGKTLSEIAVEISERSQR